MRMLGRKKVKVGNERTKEAAARTRAAVIAAVVVVACFVALALAFLLAGPSDPPADEVVGLRAYYQGGTQAGTTIDESSDIAVYAQLESGEWALVQGWSIQEPVVLEEGRFATVTVTYGDCTAKDVVECGDMSEEEFKSRCVEVTRAELVSAPDLDAGMKVKLKGAVCQVNQPQAPGEKTTYYLSGNGTFSTPARAQALAESGGDISQLAADDLVAVVFDGDVQLKEYDEVTVWGRFREMREIEVVGGAPASIPLVVGKYVERSA